MSRIRGVDVKTRNCSLVSRTIAQNVAIRKRDEAQACSSKDDAEKKQIIDLLIKLPSLFKFFEVHRKIGEGTFSSVYLASLRKHTGKSASEKRLFAIKHLVPTTHPSRVEQELRCLQEIGGKENVIGVELCLRNLDSIVFVMPYIPHTKFSELVGDMDAEELRQYMRALLIALRHVHSFGVIHRDVKPSNFLYDRENRRYLLVDFGLAQRVCSAEDAGPPPPPPAHTNGPYKRIREEDEFTSEAKRLALDLTTRSRTSAEAPLARAPEPARPTPGPRARKVRPGAERPTMRAGDETAGRSPRPLQPPAAGGRCRCAGAGAVCRECAARPAARAPRAGTQGFRPPEVLLKCAAQGTAVDTWASGVVLASVLCARYPFFRATDDVSALAEHLELLGSRALQRAAAALGRRVLASRPRPGLCLRKLSARLRGYPPPSARHTPALPCRGCRLAPSRCLCRDERVPAEWFEPGGTTAGFPDSAFSLAVQLLEPDPCLRLSAAAALRHPFLATD